MNKSAKLSGNVVQTIILGLVVLVVLFNIYATIMPEAESAGDELGDAARCIEVGCAYNATDTWLESGYACAVNSSPEGNATACGSSYEVPLSGLFASGGIIFIIVMAMFAIMIVKSYISKSN